nr:uncharacterized protein LOC128685751 [Cherax quadricarinatus]
MIHLEFKSIVPQIQDIISLNVFDYLQNIILIKCQSPDDKDNWEPGELTRFRIDLQSVDRLYHARCFRGAPLRSTVLKGHATAVQFELVVHMKYRGKFIFVEFIIDCAIPCIMGFWKNCGRMYITYDANLFFNVIQTITKKDLMYKSLNEDEYCFQWVYLFIYLFIYLKICAHIQRGRSRFVYELIFRPQLLQPNRPTLNFLCHRTISNNLKTLEHDLQIMPVMLKNTLTQFSAVRRAREIYDFLVYPSALPQEVF